jgi:hypothetical protein
MKGGGDIIHMRLKGGKEENVVESTWVNHDAVGC